MASLPPRQTQRRVSPSQASTAASASDLTSRENSQAAASTHSLDSETVFLSDPKAPESDSRTLSPAQDQTAAEPASADQTKATSSQEEEPKRCWICFGDSTDDPPDHSPWRSPCSCALTAHESCLLDWIADKESPDAASSTAAPQRIECPQCKTPIQLERPRSYVTEAYVAVEKALHKLVLPGVVGILGYTVLLAADHHGAHTIRMVFGPDEAERILEPIRDWSWIERQAHRYLPHISEPLFRNWRGFRVELGLPIVPGALVLSRTHLADAILPILPIVFFATHKPSSETLAMGEWPPSAALTLVVLPYVRSAYDTYLERVWGKWEKQWVKEIQPQLGQSDGDGRADNQDAQERNDGEGVDIELGIEVNIVDEDETDSEDEEDEDRRRLEQGRAPALNAPPADQQNQEDPNLQAQNQRQQQNAPQQNQQGQARNQNNQQGHRHDTNLIINTFRLADTVLGALLFPSVAAACGEFFRVLFPKLTASPSWNRRPTGLLQTRWGRSIVGGCLFVVLKDALRIYCRWRMAVAFRQRKVKDYIKKG